jgi:hypothetical protein
MCPNNLKNRRSIMPKAIYTASKGLYQTAGSGVELNGNQLVGNVRKVRTITTADAAAGVAFSAADSGVIISILSSVGGVACTLPDATVAGAGWYCDICYAADTPGGDVTFTGGTFKVIQVDGGTTTVAPTSGVELTCVTVGSTAGDRARVWCDGTFYYNMAAASAASIFAAV